ncbi:MAG: flavodoxin domain-containing protein [Candidatus Bathyarchaeia archaeon]
MSGIKMKALIAYGTRYGATAGTSEEIAKVLREEGFDVKVANLKEEKVKDVSEYDLIVVGSGMRIFRWTSEPEDFLKKFQKQLAQKKVALFISSMKEAMEREGKKDEIAKEWKDSLEDKAAKYNLHPISMAMFGGVLDQNKLGFLFGNFFKSIKPQLEADGFKEDPPGVFDMRNWDEIRRWAKDLAEKAKQP